MDGMGGVLKVTRVGLVGLVVVLMSAVAALPVAGGQAPHSPAAAHADERLVRVAETIYAKGGHTDLPPHISTLLGLSQEQTCPFMQGVVRTGSKVQGFEVSVKDKNDIVLFVVDETANDQNLYLTSPNGTLRKVVAVKAGVGQETRISTKDREAFEKEKQYWLDRVAPVGGAK
jgi:hypothetical protein